MSRSRQADWCTGTFQEEFDKGKLRRKTTYGKMWVVKLPHCQILMKGHDFEADKPLAIHFGDLCLWFGTRYEGRGRGRSRDHDFTPENRINQPDGDLADSGMIAKQAIPLKEGRVGYAYVIELAGSCYLVDATVGAYRPETVHMVYDVSSHSDFRYDHWNINRLLSCRQLPNRVDSVMKARTALIPEEVRENPDRAVAIGGRWFLEVPDGVSVPEFDQDLLETLGTFPNPFSYSSIPKFLESDMTLTLKYGYSSSSTVTLKEKGCSDVEIKEIHEYLSAREKWSTAKRAFANFYDMNTTDLYSYYLSRMSLGSSNKVSMEVRNTPFATYVKGVYRSVRTTNSPPFKVVMDKWHKLFPKEKVLDY